METNKVKVEGKSFKMEIKENKNRDKMVKGGKHRKVDCIKWGIKLFKSVNKEN